MSVRRIGFAYNPTIERGVRAARARGGLVPGAGRGAVGGAGRRPRRPSWASCPRRTCWSSSAATGRSCAPPRPSPRWTSRSSASTWARSASCPRPRRTSSRRCWRGSWRGTTRSGSGWASPARSCRPAARPTTTFTALNDIVVARGSLARVVRLDVTIDESHLATFVADGLVVSSPTGSTGYSFSAGGPILDPQSRNLVVTPIAGYLSAIRSIVVSPDAGRPLPRPRRPRGPRLDRRARGPPDRGRRRRRGPGHGSGRSGSSSRRGRSRSGTSSGRRSSCCRPDDGDRPLPGPRRPPASSWRSPTSR